MSIELSKIVPSESDLGKKLTWVEFKGVRFQIRYVSRATIAHLSESCMTASFDPKSRSRTRQIDADKFIESVAVTIVKDWDQCTLSALSKLMVLDTEGMDEAKLTEAIPFTKDNLMSVIRNVHELDGFLQDCAVDAALFRPEKAEELSKNLPTSPTGA
jgi:hypothetical protein